MGSSRGPSPSTNLTPWPSASGTIRISENKIAASKLYLRIGCSVTSAACEASELTGRKGYRAEALLALDEKARRELSERTAPLEVGPLARDVTFIYSFRGQLQEQMKKPHRRYQRQTFRA